MRDADADQPSVTVNVPAGTGDWFGGWMGLVQSEGHRNANSDASAGRKVLSLIERGVPALMLSLAWAVRQRQRRRFSTFPIDRNRLGKSLPR